MKIHSVKTKAICLLLCIFFCTVDMACKKLIAIDEPINTLTTAEIFSTDATAASAMAGVYSTMINGSTGGNAIASYGSEFSAGLTTGVSAQSSDELYSYSFVGNLSGDVYRSNHLTAQNAAYSTTIWTSAYDIIYKSNSVIEGISASKAPMLHDSVRNELTAEAKFTRAFSYFYLTNFFGDVPMALTVDFNKTENLARMPRQQVYQQIIIDLKAAQAALPADYSVGHGERIIPNKWAATLLLARAYLYTGDYANAATQASAVINNSSLFGLEPDLNNVFSTTSREAVWQLKQTTTDATLKNGTPEGMSLSALTTDHHGYTQYGLTTELLSAFEPGDQRRVKWVDSTDDAAQGATLPMIYYPYKYIIGVGNADVSQPPPQYYMALRLAEAYLIRAEAEANGATGSAPAAIADLNVIRNRAGLPNLSSNLIQQQVINAVAQERRIEFFAEWGHRWFDLKRTGQAHAALSVIPAKQPWAGDYQLLYPIPLSEIIIDHFLTQNTGY
jgi:hypothetical protein